MRPLTVQVLALVSWACCIPAPASKPASNSGSSPAKLVASASTATPKPTGKWQSQTTTSKIDDSQGVTLVLPAEGYIEGWPGKRERAILYLRCQSNKTEAFIVTGMSPLVEYGMHDEATILLRFGKETAVRQVASKSTDGEALFLRNGVAQVRAMLKHDRMLFQFTPFNSSPQQAEFDLRGLSTAIPPLQKACGW